MWWKLFGNFPQLVFQNAPITPTVSKSYDAQVTPSLGNILADSIDFRLRNTADSLAQVVPLLPDFEGKFLTIFSSRNYRGLKGTHALLISIQNYVKAVAESIFSLADESAIANVLRLYNENTSIWSLKICATVLNPHQDSECELGGRSASFTRL